MTNSQSLIHVSGQVGANKHGQVPDDYASQIYLAILNLRKVLSAAGASVGDIAKLNVYIVNYDPKQRLHVKPLQYFLGTHRPAMTLAPVPQLAFPNLFIEIDAVVAGGGLQRLYQSSAVPRQLSASAPESYDVVIVGAGLSGLTAARGLIRDGYSCLVLEARDRVGGRTWSKQHASGKGTSDLGAAWINDTNQSHAYALAKEFGAELIEQNTTGNVVIEEEDGKIGTFQYGDLPNLGAATQKHLAEIRDMVEADCQKVDCASPQDSNLDSMTFAAYLRSRNASSVALATATVWTRAMLGHEPEDISALFFLNYCKSGGGLLQMRSDRKGGGQHLRIRQGTQLFSKGLAGSLPQWTIRLSSPVSRIRAISRRNVVLQAGSSTIRAKQVICSIPPPALKNVYFEPALPAAKQLLADSFTYGYYSKALLVFKTPFWVEKGYCGLVQSFKGPAAVVRDSSSPKDGRHELTCFMAGVPGRTWSQLEPQAKRVDALLEQVGSLFGDVDRVRADFQELVHNEWVREPFSGYGCPSSALPPGVLDSVGDALREPHGDVHFVGTETAAEWKGYMEGAIRSGERGAAEVQRELQRIKEKL